MKITPVPKLSDAVKALEEELANRRARVDSIEMAYKLSEEELDRANKKITELQCALDRANANSFNMKQSDCLMNPRDNAAPQPVQPVKDWETREPQEASPTPQDFVRAGYSPDGRPPLGVGIHRSGPVYGCVAGNVVPANGGSQLLVWGKDAQSPYLTSPPVEWFIPAPGKWTWSEHHLGWVHPDGPNVIIMPPKVGQRVRVTKEQDAPAWRGTIVGNIEQIVHWWADVKWDAGPLPVSCWRLDEMEPV